MTTARRLALIAALALLPIVPYILLGYTGQDLPFHVSSWLDLKAGWQIGRLNPGWSAAANFGRGDPHLTIYPPVSYFLGAFLTLILPLRFAPAAFVWIALALSGVAMYVASKPFVADRDRCPAAILYMLGPYTIATSLVRFAAAELLVEAWLPLIALFFYQVVWTPSSSGSKDLKARRKAFLLLSLLLGLSWLTNIPASIALLYSLGVAAALGAVLRRSFAPLLRFVVAEAIAAALACFHLLPVWKERLWVHPDTLLRIDPLQLLLFMPHYSFNDSPLLIACWIFLCAQALLALACLRRRTLPLSANSAVSLWACLSAAAFLLQSPLAIPFWQHAPELRFIQFPLRFLSVLGVAIPLLLFSHGTRLSLRRPAYALTALLSVMPFLAYISEQAVPANRSPPLPQLLALWQQRGAPEYLPAGTIPPVGPADFPAISSVNPSIPLAPDLSCEATLERQSPKKRTFQTASNGPCLVRLPIYFYPYWRASDELGHTVAVSRDPTGFLLVDVPPGSHTVSLIFDPTSPIRTAGTIVSAATLLLLAAIFLLDHTRRSRSSRLESLTPVP